MNQGTLPPLDDVLGQATITVEQAAGLLGLGRTAAYEAARRGEFPTRRVGRRVVVPVPALLEWLRASGEPPAGEVTAKRERCLAAGVDSRSGARRRSPESPRPTGSTRPSGSGRGHIRRRGSKWAVVVDVGRDAQGRRRQRWHSGFSTKREASAALTEILGQLSANRYVASSKLTVGCFLEDEWLPAIRGRVRPLTFASYAGNVRNHVVPRVGSVPLQRLTPPMLNSMYSDLAQTLSPRTVRYIHTILHRAFADAVRWGRLAHNPVGDCGPPPACDGGGRATETWSSTELARFLEATGDDRLYACWRFLAMTGCRRGEAVGLRWRDLDLDRRRATIVQTLAANRTIAATKTERGRRCIALDAVTCAALGHHREAQDEERVSLGASYAGHDLVFCGADGSPLWPRSVSRAFAGLVEGVGLPRIRLHGLRHTHATLALQAGVHPKVVQERLGHATVAITLDVYSHAVPALHEEAADRIAALIAPAPPEVGGAKLDGLTGTDAAMTPAR